MNKNNDKVQRIARKREIQEFLSHPNKLLYILKHSEQLFWGEKPPFHDNTSYGSLGCSGN
jgi:hypothetical protein